MRISDAFWETIDSARTGTDPLAPSADTGALKRILEARSSEDVAAFGHDFYQALIDLNRWSVWEAGIVIAGGMGDDSFHYFRSWLIGKGKAAYQTALQSPDDLGRFVEPEEQEFDNESLEYAALEILQARGLPDPRDGFEIDCDTYTEGGAYEEDEIYDHYPKLAARFSPWAL